MIKIQTKYKTPPGKRLIIASRKHRVLKQVLDVFHVSQIAEDYYALWHEAETDEEKIAIWQEYKRQLILAPLGIFAAEGLLALVVDSVLSHLVPLNSLFLFSGILLITYVAGRK